MTEELKKLNEWAKMSCANWNKDPATHEFYREKYKVAAEAYWRSEKHQRLMYKYRSGDHCVNTYPWPYCEAGFANWEESADKDTYSLILDQSGCVVKHSTSYCAWKIFEITGRWPQRTSHEQLDARHWVQFLAEAGYAEVLKDKEMPKMFSYYVGIKRPEKDRSKSGQVVWMEFASDPEDHWATVSSYVDKKYKIWTVDTYDFQWVFIK